MREITVNKNDAGQRLDKFIQKRFKTMPLPLMYRFIRQKKIKVNAKRAEINTMLCEGDVIKLFIPEEFFDERSSAENSFMKLTPRLNVVYEDENIMLVEKRAGMIVHSDDEQETDTLIDHIKAYLYKKGEWNPEDENTFAPALCNRIDRNTGGIVIAAKNAPTLRIINEKIKNNEITKKYLCAAHGIFDKKSATLKGWLRKDSKTNMVTVYEKKPRFNDAKEIITKYRVLSEKNGLSLCEVELVTGRTHQIRAHFSSIGHALLGDGKYGVNRDDKKKGYKFQALYSYHLTFSFKGEGDGIFEYLSGKSFSVDKNNIWFLSEFK